MKPDYDVIVAGAGPAGAATARDLAATGFRVLLLEEHAEIGEPLHCSGLITERTLRLANAGDGFVLNRITGAHINLPSHDVIAVGGEDTQAVVIDRVHLDRELVCCAQSKGVELRRSCKFVGFTPSSCGVVVEVEAAGRRESISARLLVGADGAQSRVARCMGAPIPSHHRLVGVSVEMTLEPRRRDFVEVFVGNSVAPGFFGWLIPTGRDQVRVGLATNGCRRPIHFLRELIEAFPAVFQGAVPGRFSGGVIPLSQVEKPYGDNVLLVGDAAGQVKPTSGGGIYSGLVGAKHAAAVAAEALARDDLSADFLSRYETAWREELGDEFTRMEDMRRLFLTLSDSDFERLGHLLESRQIQRLITQHGDIDFPSSLALRLAQSPAAWSLAKIALLKMPWQRLMR